jgi:hypothetical protein
VIDYETFCRIHDCHDRQGLTIAQTACELGLHPQTVAKWLARARYERRRSQLRSSVLDPFKGRIMRLLDTHPYSAQQILQRLRGEGYGGGVTILRDYVGRIRPTKLPVYLKLHFAAGECAQVLGRLWHRGSRQYAPPALVLRHGVGLQPSNVCGVHRLPDHGALPGLPPTRLRSLGWRADLGSGNRVVGVEHNRNSSGGREHFLKDLQPFRCKLSAHIRYARDISARSRKVADEPVRDRIPITMEISLVALIAARVPGVLIATMTSTFICTNSAASSGSRSSLESADRTMRRAFRPSA